MRRKCCLSASDESEGGENELYSLPFNDAARCITMALVVVVEGPLSSSSRSAVLTGSAAAGFANSARKWEKVVGGSLGVALASSSPEAAQTDEERLAGWLAVPGRASGARRGTAFGAAAMRCAREREF